MPSFPLGIDTSRQSHYSAVKTKHTLRTHINPTEPHWSLFSSIKITRKKRQRQNRWKRRLHNLADSLQLHPFLPARQGLSAAFGIQAAVGKWQGCDVTGAGKFFQWMPWRGTRVGITQSARAPTSAFSSCCPPSVNPGALSLITFASSNNCNPSTPALDSSQLILTQKGTELKLQFKKEINGNIEPFHSGHRTPKRTEVFSSGCCRFYLVNLPTHFSEVT